VQVCEGMTSRQTRENSTAETKTLLSCEPERLGHATFLDEELKEVVLARRTCIEICLTSNLLCVFPFFALWPPPSVRPPSPRRCKTVEQLQDHHIRYYLARNHPIAICVRPFIMNALAFALFISRPARPDSLRAPPQTDDILPFRNSILGEYALLMAPQPVGLGLTESEVETIARMGMESRFPSRLR